MGIKCVFSNLTFPHSFKTVLIGNTLEYGETLSSKLFHLLLMLDPLKGKTLSSKIRGISKYKFLWESNADKIQIKK